MATISLIVGVAKLSPKSEKDSEKDKENKIIQEKLDPDPYSRSAKFFIIKHLKKGKSDENIKLRLKLRGLEEYSYLIPLIRKELKIPQN